MPQHISTILQTNKDSRDVVQRRLSQVMAGDTLAHQFQPGRAVHTWTFVQTQTTVHHVNTKNKIEL